MGIEFIIPNGAGGPAPMIADRELYEDASRSRLLEAGDPDSAFLVVSHPGKVIPALAVERLGLVVDKDGKVRQASAMKERKGGKDKERAGSGSTKGRARASKG